MIFDRTQEDVDLAIKVRQKMQVQYYPTLTDEEKNALVRGTFGIEDLNRIENKEQELKNLLNEVGYYNIGIANRTWTARDIFDIGDFNRIIYNANQLRESFFVYQDTPETPTAKYHFENINALEKILEDLDVMINDVKSNYRECGTFNCGE